MNKQLSILVIGGYGEFGKKLSELLIRDKHKVTVAGRNFNKAQAFCNMYGGTPYKLDIQSNLDEIASLNIDVIVDAAGPYQEYNRKDEHYKVATTALKLNINYLDLSDDGYFSQGISALDALAKKHNCFALSGASSTPALSGSAVSAMKTNITHIDKIETTILPGIKAPRGYSVMWAILNQIGNPMPFWRNDKWINCNGWSESVTKFIDSKIKRKASLIHTADVILFPEYFNASSVLFRAGLALPLMQKSLHFLGLMRANKYLPNLVKFISPLSLLATLLTPFGNDHGGMLVEIIGHSSNHNEQNDSLIQKTWILKAKPNQGPYIPSIAIRSLLRNFKDIPIGARPCIDELPLSLYEESMNDIDVETKIQSTNFEFLFQSTLNKYWSSLPKALQESHKVIDRKVLTGTANVTRGKGLIPKLIARLFKFPNADKNIPVEVIKSRIGDIEIWERNFNGQKFKSTLKKTEVTKEKSSDVYIEEQFGLMKFILKLTVVDEVIHMYVDKGSMIGINIPSFLLPISNTQEFVEDNTMNFSVELLSPLKLGLIVKYEGFLS